MKTLCKTILKILCILILLIGLLVAFHFSFNYFGRMFIGKNDYYFIASKYTIIYSVVASLIITSLVFLRLFKEESKQYIPYIFNKITLPIVIILLVLTYCLALFQMNVIYEDKIVSYSLFSLKGKEYKLEEIEEAFVSIKKGFYGKYELEYTIQIHSKKIEVNRHAIDLGLELKEFDHILLFHQDLVRKNIKITIDDKYLEVYKTTLKESSQEKINKIFGLGEK